jgi:hypothetical protein
MRGYHFPGRKLSRWNHVVMASACIACFLSCIDIKGYADRMPIPVTALFSESAFALLFAMIFNLIVFWCVQGMPESHINETRWKRHLYKHVLPFLWIVIAGIRVGLGTAEWLTSTGGERHHNGTINAVKHCLTCSCLLGMCVAAILSSISEEKFKPTAGRGGSAEYVEDGTKKINNKGHLTLMLLVLVIYSWYTIRKAVPRIGKTEKMVSA